MKHYNFKDGKKEVVETLLNKTEIKKCDEIPLNDDQYPSDSIGVKTWVSSLFVDIVDSTNLFSLKNISQDSLGRLMRAFVQQIVEIINCNEDCVEIGVRGDCIYGVFKASYKENLLKLFRTSYCINTFLKMFNDILTQNSYPAITAGIGLGCGEDMIVRAEKNFLISDKIFIGKALANASDLSKIAARNYFDPICMDNLFYSNIIDLLKKENPNYIEWIKPKQTFGYEGTFYMCNIVQHDFNEWIISGMKTE